MAKRRKRTEPREEVVTIEAVCGAEDAEDRWMRAFDVLAEYAAEAEKAREP